MSDADFIDTVLRHLEMLDTACLRLIDAYDAKPRDLQVEKQKFQEMNACKTKLLNHDLLRLDALAMNALHSSPGEWSVRFLKELTDRGVSNVGDIHCRVRRRHPSLLNLAKLLRGAVRNVQGEGEQAEEIKTKSKVRRAGKRRLEDSNHLKLCVYQRIQQVHQPGGQYLDTVARLKQDAHFLKNVQDAKVKLNRALVRNALAFFDRRKRLQTPDNQ